MKTVKIGVMPRDKIQKRIIDIAAGRYKPKRGEPKIWFSSIKSVAQILDEKNIKLLQIMDEKKPETIRELAKYSGREESNLSRTLKKLESYGVVRIERKNKQAKPIAKATQFNICYGFY